jgi:hypothetical protein
MRIKYNLARKIVATIIDYTLIFAFNIWYLFEFGKPGEDGAYAISGLEVLLPILVWILYFVIAEKYCSATLGTKL